MQRNIDPDEFTRIAENALTMGDSELLSRSIRYRWQLRQISGLLKHHDVKVRQLAAVTIGVIGDINNIPSLIRALRDTEPLVNQMAEHGLWSIWLRGVSHKAFKPFKFAMALLGEDRYQQAIVQFEKVSIIDPKYAEAYNQSAISYYFLSHWSSALKNWQQTIEIIPVHFAAIAGIGHCYMQLNRPNAAIRYYKHALRINPHMPAIRKAVSELQSNYEQSINDQTGEFQYLAK